MKVKKRKFARRGISRFLIMIFMATLVINDLAPIIAGAEEVIDSFTVAIKDERHHGAKIIFTDENNKDKVISASVDKEGKAVFNNLLSTNTTYRLQVTGVAGYEYSAEKVDLKLYPNKTMEINMVPIEEKKFTITINQPEHGKILRADNKEIEANKITLLQGESITLSVATNKGFQLKEVKINGKTAAVNENGNFTISNLQEDITVEASFNDLLPPDLGKITVSKESEWANEKFINYEANDNDKVKAVYYSYEPNLKASDLESNLGKTVWIAGNPIRADKNGNIYIYAVDNADHVTMKEITISKIDTKAPKIGDISQKETGKLWYKKITYSFNIEETESGIAKVYYASRKDADTGAEIKVVDGKYTFEVSKNQEWYIFAIDYAGNKTITSKTTSNIDTKAPVISDLQSSKEWDAKKNIVTFQVSEENTLDKVYYSTLDKYVEGSENLIELKGKEGKYSFESLENGKYYIFAVDQAGNVGKASVEIDHIDNKSPEIKKVEKSTKREWDNSSIIVYITAEDSQSGVSKVFYSTKYQSYEEAQDKKGLIEAVYENGRYKIEVPEGEFNGRYYIWAVDSVNRVSEASSIEIKIDRTPPSDLKLTYVEDKDKGFIKKFLNFISFGLLYKDKIHIIMEAKDARETFDSGLAYYEYQMVPEGEELLEDRWVKVDSQENKVEEKIPYKEFTGKIYFRAWDKAGNSTEAVTDKDGTPVVIDKETSLYAPTVNTNGYEEGVWTNSPVVISLKDAATLSGVDYYEYRVDYTDPAKEDTVWARLPDTDGLLPHMDGGTISNKITLNEDFNGRLYFRAVSNNMNTSPETKGTEVKLQRSLPENSNLTIKEANGKNGWYVESYPSITIEEPVTGEFSPSVSAYYKLWNETKQESDESADAVLFDGKNNPVIKEDGIYKLKLWTVDEAGNPSSDSSMVIKEIKVDITAPDSLNIEVLDKSILPKDSNSISYSLFYDKEIKVKMSANTDISGLKALTYQKVKGPQEYDKEKGRWLTYDGEEGITIVPNDKFVIYLKAEDMAGNTTIVNSEGVIVDNKPPTGENYAPDIIITPEAANKNGYHNKDVKVQILAADPKYIGSTPDSKNGFYSGLAKLSYRILSEDSVTKEEILILEGNGSEVIKDEAGLIQSFKGSIVIDSKENNSNGVVVEVTAIDKAGNVTITRTPVGAIKIDTTAPKIDVSYNNNSADSQNFFKEDRTATITITERNFNNDDVKIQVTNSDGEIPSVTNWEKISGSGNGNGDNTLYRATLSFKADGDYTFKIEYTDLADNKAGAVNYSEGTVYPEEFTIDKTLPKVTVTYDNNIVRNGKYFNKGRTATITVEEHNFTADRTSYTVTAMKNGAPITNPALSGWSKNGDIYTATLSFSQDGDYTFDFKLSDMAGNEAQGVNYGASAASKDFVVDTTIDAPIIKGVSNGSAYKAQVIPETELSDLNFEGYKLQLLRTRRGEINADVTKEFLKELNTTTQGAYGIHDTFREIKENDGIYTLTATVMDKAGNEESTKVTFSVNRFGSVYVYNDYLSKLQDSYVQKVKEDIVITEFNPNKLLEGSAKVEITLDGKPLGEIKYGVSPVVNHSAPIGSSGWYQYDYSIAASNFERDGIYKVVVSSEDEAGNKPETINYDGGEVLFRVDTTSPEISSIRGLHSKYYNAETLKVDFDIFDSIGLKEARVYVSGKEAAVFNNFENLTNFTGTFEIGEGMNQQIKIVVLDLAGNITDTSQNGFKPGFVFENNITVSTNALIRLYANKPLFGSSIAGALALFAGVGFFILKRRGKVTKIKK
ncbi:hypothetical protein [Clostridium polynesiense]|uniref:hypothetical protein n=1 Tax=Clostridium polynesiense TaxID=1325933 RepID=UPI00058C0301|nr:hypothetical protein [Clostridium polynesiense]